MNPNVPLEGLHASGMRTTEELLEATLTPAELKASAKLMSRRRKRTAKTTEEGFPVGSFNLSDKERKEFLQPGEFILEVDPALNRMPSKEVLMRDFHFVEVATIFPENKPFADFNLTPEALQSIGITDSKRQHSILKALEKANDPGTRIVKVVDISDLLKQKGVDHLTTKELLEIMDDAGYRPATLMEIMAYAKTHWKPYVAGLTEQEKSELADSKFIVGLGSFTLDGDSFTLDGDGDRYVAVLHARDSGPCLDDGWFGSGWVESLRFLFVRK